jgi:hypothetical protein
MRRRWRTGPRGRPLALAAAASAVLALALAGCTGGTGGTDRATTAPPPAGLRWSETVLPGGTAPVTLTDVDGTLLVGGRAPEGAPIRPRLLLLDPADPTRVQRELPVRPASPTAYQARWLTVTVRDGTVTAVGGAPAGAHSNTRWSTWTGTLDAGVRELPQRFETFGGWGAGTVTALVATTHRDVLVGSWQGSTGDDIVTWRPEGDRWVRTASAGTPLASTATLLTTGRGATDWGRGVLVVGSTTSLQPGRVAQRPAAWRATSTAGPWTRVDLPADGATGEAHAATCDLERCVVVGRLGGRLAAWEVAGTGARRLPGMPSWPVGERDLLAPPVLLPGARLLVVPHDGRARVLEVRGDAVAERPGPEAEAASVEALAATGGRLAVVTAGEQGGQGGTRLWTTAYPLTAPPSR